jgi:phage/plasmid-associated DNA primase
MLTNFFIKKILGQQLKNIPEEQKEKILKIISQNPEFFNKIIEEVKKEINSGKDQMSAVIDVISRYKEEIKKLAGET